MRDPTREEMLEFLEAEDEFDREEGLYWFANDYHSRQGSNLYSVLSTSEYNPGPLRNRPEDMSIYRMLEREYK